MISPSACPRSGSTRKYEAAPVNASALRSATTRAFTPLWIPPFSACVAVGGSNGWMFFNLHPDNVITLCHEDSGVTTQSARHLPLLTPSPVRNELPRRVLMPAAALARLARCFPARPRAVAFCGLGLLDGDVEVGERDRAWPTHALNPLRPAGLEGDSRIAAHVAQGHEVVKHRRIAPSTGLVDHLTNSSTSTSSTARGSSEHVAASTASLEKLPAR